MNTPLPLDDLMASWLIYLKAQRKSPHTIRTYGMGVRLLLRFLATEGMAQELTKANVRAFLASLSDNSPATAQAWLSGIKRFAQWLADEEGFDATGIMAVRAPRTDQKAVSHLSEDEVHRLLKACDGSDFRDKRDKAAVLLFAETGLRASELLRLEVGDVDLATCTAHVRRGKGGVGRRVKFSATCAAVVDRYLRARRALRHPGTALWVGPQGQLTYGGIVYTLKLRAEIAGIKGFHLHRLRHSMAVRWLKRGGSETGLMAQAGWKSRTMISRYTASANEALAAAEFDRLNMGIDP
jgi:site-specific recombinase XerD